MGRGVGGGVSEGQGGDAGEEEGEEWGLRGREEVSLPPPSILPPPLPSSHTHAPPLPIQICFQFSSLPIHVIEKRQLTIKKMSSIFLFQAIQYSNYSQSNIFIK